MEKRKVYIAEFMSVSGKVRYVGAGATMPFDKGQAFQFATKQEARAALARIGKHHRAGTYEHIGTKTVLINKPAFMVALGL